MPREIQLKGDLKRTGLPRILNHLYEIKANGTLSLEKDGVTKKLYIKNGAIIFANSTYQDDRLGEILLKEGKIIVSQFETASKVVVQTGKRLGGVLVELGYLKPKDLFWGVKHQVQEIVCGLFEWDDGSYEFTPGQLPSTEVITLHMSTANLIIQGVKNIDDWTRISRGIPPMESVLRLTSNPLKLYRDLDVSKDEKQLLSLFDGSRTIKEVFSEVKIGDFEALKAVYIFYTIGMLEEADAGGGREKKPVASLDDSGSRTDGEAINKAYIASRGQNHYELLMLDVEASAAEIDEAYQRLSKLYHPDQQFRPGMEQLRGELEELSAKVNEAYKVLSDDSIRWEYDLSLSTVMGGGKARASGTSAPGGGNGGGRAKDPAKALEAYQKGVQSMKAGDYESATVLFKEATRMDATRADYFSYLALALLHRPKREAEAEEAMLEAIKLAPENPELHANLGLLYQKAGIRDKAREAFNKALNHDPNNVKAKKGLEAVR